MPNVYLFRNQARGKKYYAKWQDEEGKWQQRSLGTKNKATAQLALSKLEKKLAGILDKPAPAKKTGSSLDTEEIRRRYFEWASANVSTATHDVRQWAWNAFWEACPGGSIDSLTKDQIEAAKGKLLARYAARSARDVIRSMRTIYNKSISHGWLPRPNPFEGIDVRISRQPVHWLSRNELATVLAAAKAHGRNAECFVGLCVYAGLRKGEAVAARWEWIDWEAGLLTVQAGPGFAPKDREYRTIPLHDALRAILLPHAEESGYIVAPKKELGKYQKYRFDVRKTFAAVQKAAELDDLTPHRLRHTFASQLVSAGVSIYKVSRWLGHSSVAVTEKVYAHLSPADSDINSF